MPHTFVFVGEALAKGPVFEDGEEVLRSRDVVMGERVLAEHLAELHRCLQKITIEMQWKASSLDWFTTVCTTSSSECSRSQAVTVSPSFSLSWALVAQKTLRPV